MNPEAFCFGIFLLIIGCFKPIGLASTAAPIAIGEHQCSAAAFASFIPIAIGRTQPLAGPKQKRWLMQ